MAKRLPRIKEKLPLVFTVTNLFFSAILWLLGVTDLALNLARLWEFWQGVGFAFAVICLPTATVSQALALTFSIVFKNRLLTVINAISTGITAVSALLFFLLTANYG